MDFPVVRKPTCTELQGRAHAAKKNKVKNSKKQKKGSRLSTFYQVVNYLKRTFHT